MKLKFDSGYLSIKNEEQVSNCELPNFTVLTGLNGSGKSHILQAIAQGNITCDGIDQSAILFVSYEQLLNNQFSKVSVQKSCEDFLKSKIGKSEPDVTWERKIRDIYEEYLVKRDAETHHFIVEQLKVDKPVWSIKADDLTPELWERLCAFKKKIGRQIFGNAEFQKFELHHHIEETYKLYAHVSAGRGLYYSKFVDVIGTEKLEDLSVQFQAYGKERESYALEQFENNRRGSRLAWHKEYDKNYKKPWELLNRILSEIRQLFKDRNVFNFRVTHPDMGSIWNMDKKALIHNTSNNAKIEFENLSSGEKVIFSLLMFAFGNEKGLLPPKLVLLDEIDATLHPSMIKAMITIIDKVFLQRGSNVILATHSPTTLSLVDDNSIYLVQPGQTANKIQKTTKSEALNSLTEGYATLQDLIRFGESNKEYIVVSEGRNCRYLEKACHFFDPDETIEVLNLEVFGTNQLREIFKFMKSINKTRKFVFVWDCDYREKEKRDYHNNIIRGNDGSPVYETRDLKELLRNDDLYNRAFVFDYNANSKSKRGIENLFDAADTESFGITFNQKGPTNKKSFEQHTFNNASKELFRNFEELFCFIKDNSNTRDAHGNCSKPS